MKFLNKNIFNYQDLVGIDVGDSNIKFVQVKNGKQNILQEFGKIPLTNGSVVDGKILNKVDVEQSIKQAYQILNLDSKNVIYTIPEKQVFYRQLVLNDVDEIAVENALKWEIDTQNEESVDNFDYTWQTLPHPVDGEKILINFLFVSKSIINQMDDIFQTLKLKPQGCEIESKAHLNYLVPKNFLNKSLLIINIGNRTTNFILYNNGIVQLTMDSPFSANLITDILAKTFNISTQEANKIKTSQGIGSVLNNDHIFQAIQPVIDGIVAQAKNVEEFYLEQNELAQQIEDVIIVGEGTKIKGLEKYLTYQLNKKQILLTQDNLNLAENSKIEEAQLAQYAAALGTAIA